MMKPDSVDKVLTMCPELGVNHVAGIHPNKNGALDTIRTCDLSLHTTMAFATSIKLFAVWTFSSPWAKAVRCYPSSLYTFL